MKYEKRPLNIFPPSKGRKSRSFLEEWFVRVCALCAKERPAYMFTHNHDHYVICVPG